MTSLTRRLAAEFLGTALLVTAVVGSGIMATRLSPGDVGLQLLENSTATVFALAVLILIFGPVSGAHFNPVVTAADWWLHRGERSARDLGAYVAAQTAGGVGGAVLANAMFGVAQGPSRTARATPQLWLGETVATAGLILLIFALVRTQRATLAAPAVGAYIGAAYWFTSSTSFANPAVAVGRAFTDTFAGIAPASLPGFVLAQIAGAAIGVALVVALFPRTTTVNGTAESEAMREVGIDITGAKPKILTPEDSEASNVVITMGCGDVCPYYPGQRHEDWKLDDPAGQGIDAVRAIRDDIRDRVRALVGDLLPEGR